MVEKWKSGKVNTNPIRRWAMTHTETGNVNNQLAGEMVRDRYERKKMQKNRKMKLTEQLLEQITRRK